METNLTLYFQLDTGNQPKIKGLEKLVLFDYESVALPLSYAGLTFLYILAKYHVLFIIFL